MISLAVLLADTIPQLRPLRVLRVMRVLRPLRLISRNAGMKLINDWPPPKRVKGATGAVAII